MKNHGLWMIIGCMLLLLLIFGLPSIGVRGDLPLFIFIILMFGGHFVNAGRSPWEARTAQSM